MGRGGASGSCDGQHGESLSQWLVRFAMEALRVVTTWTRWYQWMCEGKGTNMGYLQSVSMCAPPLRKNFRILGLGFVSYLSLLDSVRCVSVK